MKRKILLDEIDGCDSFSCNGDVGFDLESLQVVEIEGRDKHTVAWIQVYEFSFCFLEEGVLGHVWHEKVDRGHIPIVVAAMAGVLED